MQFPSKLRLALGFVQGLGAMARLQPRRNKNHPEPTFVARLGDVCWMTEVSVKAAVTSHTAERPSLYESCLRLMAWLPR